MIALTRQLSRKFSKRRKKGKINSLFRKDCFAELLIQFEGLLIFCSFVRQSIGLFAFRHLTA